MLAIDKLTEYINAYENETHGLVEIQALKNAVNALKRCDNHRRRYSLCSLIFIKGYTPLSLAKEMKVCPSTVYGWLNGTKKLSSKMKHRVANLLGVTYEEIIDVCESTEYDDLRDIIERQKTTILEYNERDAVQKAEIERLTEEIEQSKSMYDDIRKCNDILLKERAELQKQVDELEGKNTELRSQVDNLTEELSLADETIARLKERYEVVSAERQKALEKVDESTTVKADYLKDVIEKTEKCTAKEILQMADEIVTGSQNDGVNILSAIKERYGVEVE